MTSIYVGKLPESASESDMQSLFEKFGTVQRVDMKSGFAFVLMEDSGARAAIAELNGSEWNGATLQVEESKGRERNRPPHPTGAAGDYTLNPAKCVLVENLSFDTHWQDLKDHFKKVAEVARADIDMKNGKPAGTGVVEVKWYEDVPKVVQELDGSTLGGRRIRVRVSRTHEDDRREKPRYHPYERPERPAPERYERERVAYERPMERPGYERAYERAYERPPVARAERPPIERAADYRYDRVGYERPLERPLYDRAAAAFDRVEERAAYERRPLYEGRAPDPLRERYARGGYPAATYDRAAAYERPPAGYERSAVAERPRYAEAAYPPERAAYERVAPSASRTAAPAAYDRYDRRYEAERLAYAERPERAAYTSSRAAYPEAGGASYSSATAPAGYSGYRSGYR